MGENELASTILKERILIGAGIVEEMIRKFGWKMTDYEKADLAFRCGINLAIEKNKSYRMSRMDDREKAKQ